MRTDASLAQMERPARRRGRRAAVLWAVITASMVTGLTVARVDARLLPTALAPVEAIRPPYAPIVPKGPWTPTAEALALGALPMRSPLEDADERFRRIQAAVPMAGLDVDPVRAAAALQAAGIFESAGDWDAARFAYERAIVAGSDDLETWRSLARVAVRLGDGPLAEAAELGALMRLPATGDAALFVEQRAEIHRDLVTIYLLDRRWRDAAIASKSAVGIDGGNRFASAWLARQLVAIDARPRPARGVVQTAWPTPPAASWWTVADRFSLAVWQGLPTGIRSQLAAASGWLDVGTRRRTLLLLTLLGVAAFGAVQLIRQRGDLVVTMEYPDELRGVFRVRVASARARPRKGSGNLRKEILKGGVSSRHERHFVNRETQFHRMLTRRYAVTVEGVLQDPDTDEILHDFSERKMVRVRHRRTVRVEFDAQPRSCPVDVEVFWHDRAAENVSVVAADRPETLTRSRESRVRLNLDQGVHRLVVGSGDRVVEREVDVQHYSSTRVRMDLAGAEVVFKGCPPAVEPYLHGDIEAVAHALERDGQAVHAYRMLARHHAEAGDRNRAADYFESAGDIRDAAKLRAEMDDFVRAARLYAQADEPLEAAEMWRKAGDLVQAGQAFEVARDFDRAIDCYSEARAVGMWISALEKRGEIFEAATLALDNDQRPRAIRLLQCIAPDDDDFPDASWLLVGAFEREGHYDLAAHKLEQHIASHKAQGAPADRYAKLAELHEHAGHLERALEVLEDLRRREPTYPNIASRIESLKKQRSAADRIGRTSGPTVDTPTAFVAESRYEIVEEIGRGGMGVVFEARDRRLDRVVALKRLSEDLRRHQPRAVQLFLREAQAAARLNHPNIVTVHDTDQEDGHFFITMELLDGEPFNRILKDRGRLSVAQTIAVGLQVASALEYAHAQGVVHRDVKTANLFLTTDNVVKVMDFGLAKMFEEVRAGTTVISGTPYYMSPEQIVGAEVDRRTDLYSLGVTLFELVTGEVPFTQGDIAYHHRHTPAPDPRTLRPELPDALAELLLSLLAKDPALRCPDAATLTRRLQAIQRAQRTQSGSFATA